MDMQTTGTPTPSPGTSHLYTVAEAAAILGMKPDTLRFHLRHQQRVVPQRVASGRRGILLLTAADVQALWEYFRTERDF